MPHADRVLTIVLGGIVSLSACTSSGPPVPVRIVDLSPVIAEDLQVRTWGSRLLALRGIPERTHFEHYVVREPVYVANSIVGLATHGGPHVDAPNHLIEGGASVVDYDLGQLIGPLRLIDVRSFKGAGEIPRSFLEGQRIQAGEVAVLFTGYEPPPGPDALPSYAYLSRDAAEYLATIPVRAVATDAWSIDTPPGERRPGVGPQVHPPFLSRRIPVIEQLVNLDGILNEARAVFVGFPLKIQGGNGSPIRAAALVYR